MDLTAEDARKLQRLEKYLLDPNVRYSLERVAAVLADEFIEFGRSGRIYDKRQIIEAARTPSDENLSLKNSLPAGWRPMSRSSLIGA